MINLADQYIKTGQTEKALQILSTTSKLVSSLHCSVLNEVTLINLTPPHRNQFADCKESRTSRRNHL